MATEAFANLNRSVARPFSFLGERWGPLVLRLTEKSRDLRSVLPAMFAWSEGHAASPLETVHDRCGKVFHRVPTCSECEGELAIPWRER
jgi:hypothetical protein